MNEIIEAIKTIYPIAKGQGCTDKEIVAMIYECMPND